MIPTSQPWQYPLPTMYDLPSEDPEEPGLPDEFHDLQPQLLTVTCQLPVYWRDRCFMATDLNLYYDPRHTHWYKRPDWFLVLDNWRFPDQEDLRLSYVVWQEGKIPYLAIELLSPGTEREDLGQTQRQRGEPPTKWQVYEQILRIPYYLVYDRYDNRWRAFRLEGAKYQEMLLPNRRLWFEDLDLGLGLWEGVYEGSQGLWLRWYDAQGNWVPTPQERLEQEQLRTQQVQEQLEQEQLRAQQVREQLEQEQLRALAAQDQLQQVQVQLEQERLRNQQARVGEILAMANHGLTPEVIGQILNLPVAMVREVLPENIG